MANPVFVKTTDSYIAALMKVTLNAAPGYTYLTQFRSFVTENGGGTTGLQKLGSALANYASTDNAAFAASVVSNLGITGASATTATTNVKALLDSYGADRGKALMQLVDVMVNLQSDATWGTAANAFVNSVNAGYVYSVNTANTSTDLTALAAAVVVDAAGVVAGKTFTLTTAIDNLTGTAGNDTFIGDNSSANAGDTLSGGAGTDTLKLYNSVNLGNLSGIETIEINGNDGNVNVASLTDVVSVAMMNQTIAAAGAPTYTIAGTQTLTIAKVLDSDADNTDGIEVNAAATVTSQTVKLNGAGDAATGGLDLNVDINGTGVATLNVDSSTAASRVSIENTGTAIRTLNISGDAAVIVEANAAANNVGAAATKIAITNTAGATVTSSAAPSATTGLTITAVGGADTVTLAQAAGANALTNKVAVDLGAGNDTLAISLLTAATDIADGASFKGGDGTDTLKLFDGDVIDTTRGKLFSGFETVDVGAAQATTNLDLGLLAANNTIGTLKLSAANTGAVSVTNLAEAAGVLINAATGAALTINQKDSGAGSPDDTITVTYDSKTAIGAQTGATTIADVETVNLNVTSTGTNITHEVTTLVVNNATKFTVNASTAAVDIKGTFSATSLVLLDASASAKDTSIALNDAYTATAGVAVKGGAGVDTLVFTGATTGAAAATDLDFLITGNGGADVITLAAVAGGVDRVVYLAQGDSTYAKFDSITNFDSTAASAQDLLDFKAFGFTGNQQGVKDFAASAAITIAADGSVTVASSSMANFFVDTGLSRG